MLAIWAALGIYDLALSEIIPKARDAIAMTGGWLSLEVWLLILAGILVVATLEYAHRRSGGVRSISGGNGADIIDSVPPGMLDHIVDGLQAFADVTSINNLIAKESVTVSKYMARTTYIMKYVSSPRLRRKIASIIARKIEKLSITLSQSSIRLKKSAETIENSCSFIVSSSTTNTDVAIEELKQFRSTVSFSMDSFVGLRDSTEQAKITVGNMTGISRELTVASANFRKSTEEFSHELASFIDRLKRLDELCAEKIKYPQ